MKKQFIIPEKQSGERYISIGDDSSESDPDYITIGKKKIVYFTNSSKGGTVAVIVPFYDYSVCYLPGL